MVYVLRREEPSCSSAQRLSSSAQETEQLYRLCIGAVTSWLLVSFALCISSNFKHLMFDLYTSTRYTVASTQFHYTLTILNTLKHNVLLLMVLNTHTVKGNFWIVHHTFVIVPFLHNTHAKNLFIWRRRRSRMWSNIWREKKVKLSFLFLPFLLFLTKSSFIPVLFHLVIPF